VGVESGAHGECGDAREPVRIWVADGNLHEALVTLSASDGLSHVGSVHYEMRESEVYVFLESLVPSSELLLVRERLPNITIVVPTP